MNLKRPKISICIPTYNRAPLLAESLDAVTSQIGPSEAEEVELIISDNASIDHTSEVVAALIERFPELRVNYIRNPSNLGAGANIQRSLHLSTGYFVLLISDDDKLLPGAIRTLLSAIEKNRNTLVAVCLKTVPMQEDALKQQELNSGVSLLHGERDLILNHIGTSITFISCLAIDRSYVCVELPPGPGGVYFPHSYSYLRALASGGTVALAEIPMLSTRSNTSLNYNFYEVFVTGFFQILTEARSLEFSKYTLERVASHHGNWLVGWIIHLKANPRLGSHSKGLLDAISRLSHAYFAQPFTLFKLLVVLILPLQIVRLLSGAKNLLMFCRSSSQPKR